MASVPVSRILFATDLSARCDRAAARAVALARQWDAELHVVTVSEPAVPLDDHPATGDDDIVAMWRAAEQSLGGYEGARIHTLTGAPDRAIAGLADEIGGDLIITGMSGSRWLGQTRLGSTVAGLMRRGRVPLLVVKAPADRPYRRVLAAMDLSDGSRAPVEAAVRLFGDAALSIFHAFSTPYRAFVGDVDAYEAGFREGVLSEIRSALAAWSIPDTDHIPLIAEYGNPATEVAALADRHEIDLVVTGTHGRSGLMTLLLGSVAEAIIETVGCDVLVVPSRGAWTN